MVTKREYLQSKGLAGKRGRFSAAAKDELAKQINKGVKFDEPEVKEATRVTVVGKDENGRKVVKTIRVSEVPQTPDPRPDRPHGIYTFRNADGTEFTRTHTVACVHCGYSLQWCYCESGPSLFCYPYAGDEYATLVKIKAVITTKEVPTKQPTRGTTTRGGTRRGGTRRRR